LLGCSPVLPADLLVAGVPPGFVVVSGGVLLECATMFVVLLLVDIVLECGAVLCEVSLAGGATDEEMSDGTVVVLDTSLLSSSRPRAGAVAIIGIGRIASHRCGEMRQVVRKIITALWESSWGWDHCCVSTISPFPVKRVS
jgi:hypothetical protein